MSWRTKAAVVLVLAALASACASPPPAPPTIEHVYYDCSDERGLEVELADGRWIHVALEVDSALSVGPGLGQKAISGPEGTVFYVTWTPYEQPRLRPKLGEAQPERPHFTLRLLVAPGPSGRIRVLEGVELAGQDYLVLRRDGTHEVKNVVSDLFGMSRDELGEKLNEAARR